MHILVTGANGFIGRYLVNRLLAEAEARDIDCISVMDLALDHLQDHGLLNKVKGSFADETLLARILKKPADLVFHLASVPSGLAENNYPLGVDVNIHGTQTLLEKLRLQENMPRLVFASSIAVYGKPATVEVTDDTLPTPNLSYGAQKVIGETLVADHSRRQWVQGCSVRIPGIVARPPEPNGAVSIFFSDLIRSLSSGNAFTCPVSARAQSWLMSVSCCVDNLLHAATMTSGNRQTWTLPAMHIAIEELVNQLDTLFPDSDISSLITYEPDPWVEENFGSYPPLVCPLAEAAGFHHDGSLQNLVMNALDGLN